MRRVGGGRGRTGPKDRSTRKKAKRTRAEGRVNRWWRRPGGPRGQGPRVKGSGDSVGAGHQLRPPAPQPHPHPHPGCQTAVTPPVRRHGRGADFVSRQGAGPLPAQGEVAARQPMTRSRGESCGAALFARRRTECTKPPVPAPRDTPPLGTKCVLCQPSSLPSRCSRHRSICSGERSRRGNLLGADTQLRTNPCIMPRLEPRPYLALKSQAPGSHPWGSAPSCGELCPSLQRHPHHLSARTPASPTFITRPSNNQCLYYVPVFKVIPVH